MYILKNAVRSIFRSPGRTVIICLIVMCISAACCVALSIQQAAGTARLSGKNSLLIRGNIRADRKYVMETLQAANEAKESGADSASSDDASADESGDASDSSEASTMEDTIKSLSGLSLNEMLTYAEASTVQRFYWYSTLSLSGNNGLKPLNQDDHSNVQDVLNETIGTTEQQQQPQGGRGGRGGPGGPGGQGGNNISIDDIMASINFGGDFVLYGYSSDEAMEDFSSGKCYITSGSMFDEGTSDYLCIINEDLATYNSISVGDRITLNNPAATSERYTFTITGLYKSTEDTSASNSKGADDPANHILTSYPVIADIVSRSASFVDPASVDSIITADDGTKTEQLLLDDGSLNTKGQASSSDTEEESERENALTDTASGTYVFSSIEDYDAFEAESKAMGLSDNYTVISNDVASYEASLIPLDNLSSYANTFLYIVLGIGAVILIGVNIFNIRERKYEIGALTAMGMRKGKVAIQFILELTIVTFMGIALGSLLGAVASTPVANELLASQIEYVESSEGQLTQNYGRETGEQQASAKPHGGDVSGDVEYVSAVTFTFDQVIVYKMAIIGALLALVSSAAAIAFVLRYNPLEILAERD